MPAVEAIRSFTRARAYFVLALLVVVGCSDELVGPSDAFVEAPALDLAPSPEGMMGSANEHACVLRTTGVIECWGENAFGEAPQYREAVGGWYTHVEVSDQNGCAITSNGALECWGENGYGEAEPVRTPATGQYVHLATGGDHTCAVRSDGVIECWGDDSSFGDSVHTATSSYFERVTTGLFHTCGLRADGVAECWGWNPFGQAPSTRASRNGSPYIGISSSTGHTCGVRADGIVECWGQNDLGQADTLRTPSASTFTQVSAGLTHTCALRADGVIQCWGDNDEGEAPSTLSAPTGRYVHVAAGNHYTCASRSTGVVQCFGDMSAPIPAIPDSITPSVVNGQDIRVVWPDGATETSYWLERRGTTQEGVTSDYVTVARTLPSDTVFIDTTVIPALRYQYRLRACAAGGCSTVLSSTGMYPVTTAPAPASGVSAVAVQAGVVDVSWSDNDEKESSFELQRRLWNDSTSSYGAFTTIATKPANAVSHRDSSLVRGKRYQYRVRACNPVRCSFYAQSNPVVAETIATAPSNISAVALGPTAARVSWTAASNVVWYEVERRLVLGAGSFGAWVPSATVYPPAVTWDDTTVVSGSRYQYRLRACTTAGCSAYIVASGILIP